MIRKLSMESKVGKSDERKENAFRNVKLAVGLTATIGLAACGDEIHNYYTNPDASQPVINVTVVQENEPSQRSEMCSDETITIEAQSNEATVASGQTFVFPNGYRMTLLDIEADTQTAFFMLKDAEGNAIQNVDMEEAVEYQIEFSEDDVVTLAACSVRAGYRFGESSATVRADVELTLEEPSTTCESTTYTENTTHLYDADASAYQYVETTYEDNCEEVEIIHEETTFSSGIEDAALGTNFGRRVTAQVLGDVYILLSVDADSIELAKESVSGFLYEGEAIPADDLLFRLDMVEEHGGMPAAIISILDAAGNVLERDVIHEGQTTTFTIGGREYPFHVYTLAPGYTLGAQWADVAILSRIERVEDTETHTFEAGTFSFNMNWGSHGELRGWEFTRL
ncbi:hypothetical protein KKB44_06555 [Candidatus Micrarchaeota archaeon]|nr:hypothetical protein [Candidatus Micrarchaeota archaeon]